MPSQNEAMIDSFGLMVLQRGQISNGWRLGLVEKFPRPALQLPPARPVHIRRVGHLPQGAAPLDDDAVDVSGPQRFADPFVFARWVLMNGSHHLFRAGAVLRR